MRHYWKAIIPTTYPTKRNGEEVLKKGTEILLASGPTQPRVTYEYAMARVALRHEKNEELRQDIVQGTHRESFASYGEAEDEVQFLRRELRHLGEYVIESVTKIEDLPRENDSDTIDSNEG